MNLENIWKWAQIKGIKVISAADFTHPLWFAELKEKLELSENGLYKLKPEIEKPLLREVPASCRTPTFFILTSEVNCIFSKNGRTRKVHSIIFAPNLDTVQKINHRLGAISNLRSDGRPVLNLECKFLLKMIRDISPQCTLVPAHIWTPHFSLLGSNSGFNTLRECFEELTPHIFAVETGLSSDPEMNWRVPTLDNVTLISNSDAHSLTKIGRECNIFNTELSYDGIFNAMKKDDMREGEKLAMTIEFFPEEGKYHADGHIDCGIGMKPAQSIENNKICPKCAKTLTIGVLHRVEELAQRPEGYKPDAPQAYKKMIPLAEIIGEAFGISSESTTVLNEYLNLISHFGNEIKILLRVPLHEFHNIAHPLVIEGLKRVREDKIFIESGYDGRFGKIHMFSQEEREKKTKNQAAMF